MYDGEIFYILARLDDLTCICK